MTLYWWHLSPTTFPLVSPKQNKSFQCVLFPHGVYHSLITCLVRSKFPESPAMRAKLPLPQSSSSSAYLSYHHISIAISCAPLSHTPWGLYITLPGSIVCQGHIPGFQVGLRWKFKWQRPTWPSSTFLTILPVNRINVLAPSLKNVQEEKNLLN